tara:strand:+ start:637 stop:1077 length:441 start_codon:yes stop_codon:yes gene_type:complete
MAHFAKISENNEVLTVLTLNNVDMHNADGVENETVGQQYLEKHNNWPAQMWIQTSYNTSNNQHKNGGIALRGNYAGIGSIWDEENQIFWPKKPYTSWVKNITEARWQSPIGDEPTLTAEQEADTTNKYSYLWNEDEQSWNLFTIEV